jgi:hypothetical protein
MNVAMLTQSLTTRAHSLDRSSFAENPDLIPFFKFRNSAKPKDISTVPPH